MSPSAPSTPSAEAESGRGSEHAASSARLARVPYASAATGAERDYFLYFPKGYDDVENNRWPVLVVLHGDGERGDAKRDLDYLLKNGPLYEAWIQKRDLPFIIVAPQLPLYGRDTTVSYLKDRTRAEIPERLPSGVPARPPEHETPSPMLGAVADAALPWGPEGPPDGWPKLEADVLQIIDDVLTRSRADASRLYLTGISYGGFGAWYFASRHPQRFAAVVPVVGWGHPDLMVPIARAQIPLWVFAGGRDPAVLAQYFYPGLNRLEALGHTAWRFTIEADMGHDVWARVFAGNDVYDWMLGFSLPHPG